MAGVREGIRERKIRIGEREKEKIGKDREG